MNLEIVKRSDTQKGFRLLPRRCVVERSLAWIGTWRRMSKDHAPGELAIFPRDRGPMTLAMGWSHDPGEFAEKWSLEGGG